MALSWLQRRRETDRPVRAEPEPTAEIAGHGAVRIALTVRCLRQSCPRPQIMMMKAINQLKEGDVVELICDNASAVESIPALALVLFSTHLHTEPEDGFWRVYVRKGV